MKSKIAFISSGGGMSCAYSAGVAWALEKLNIVPDIFIGSSGSAGTISYFAIGQAELAVKCWIEEVPNPCLVKKGLHPKIDIDFLANGMRDLYTMDEKKLTDPNINLYLATTNADTIKANYFSSQKYGHVWYEVIRASMAMPFYYNKKIKIDDDFYIDGDISTNLNDHIGLAQELGADKFIIAQTDNYIPTDLFPSAILALMGNKFIRHFAVQLFKSKRKLKTNNPNYIIIKPKKSLPTLTLNNNVESIKYSIDLGYNDAMHNEEIKNIHKSLFFNL